MYIYALKNKYIDDNNLIKIGKTYDINTRLNTHNKHTYPNHRIIFVHYLPDKLYNFAEDYIFTLVNRYISKIKNTSYYIDHRHNNKEEFPISTIEFKKISFEFIRTVELAYYIKNMFIHKKKHKFYKEISNTKKYNISKYKHEPNFELELELEPKSDLKIKKTEADIISQYDHKYGEILIDKETGFINVSKVLKTVNFIHNNNNRKSYTDFKRSKNNKDKYDYIKNKIGREPEINHYLNSKRRIRGYFIHKELLFHVYVWVTHGNMENYLINIMK